MAERKQIQNQFSSKLHIKLHTYKVNKFHDFVFINIAKINFLEPIDRATTPQKSYFKIK